MPGQILFVDADIVITGENSVNTFTVIVFEAAANASRPGVLGSTERKHCKTSPLNKSAVEKISLFSPGMSLPLIFHSSFGLAPPLVIVAVKLIVAPLHKS